MSTTDYEYDYDSYTDDGSDEDGERQKELAALAAAERKRESLGEPGASMWSKGSLLFGNVNFNFGGGFGGFGFPGAAQPAYGQPQPQYGPQHQRF